MKRILDAALIYGALTALALLFVAPVAMMVAGSLKPDERVLVEAGTAAAFVPAEASLQNYTDVFARTEFMRFFFNSLFITGSIVICGLLVNSLAAYAFARLRWRRPRNLCFNLVMALMILPLEADRSAAFSTGVSILGLRDTYAAQILPFIANAFLHRPVLHIFHRPAPGAGRGRAPRRLPAPCASSSAIIVPNARPAFASAGILSFSHVVGGPTCGRRWSLSARGCAPCRWPILRPSTPCRRSSGGDILAFGVMMVAPGAAGVSDLSTRLLCAGVAASAIKG